MTKVSNYLIVCKQYFSQNVYTFLSGKVISEFIKTYSYGHSDISGEKSM
jgi:hypothetical protein